MMDREEKEGQQRQQQHQPQQGIPASTPGAIPTPGARGPVVEVLYPPKYRPGDLPAAYGIEYDSKSGSPIDNKRYHIIGVYRRPGRDVIDITWLCPFCAESDAERSMYHYLVDHIKTTHIYARNIAFKAPLVQSPDEVSYQTRRREFNIKNMKRAYADTWECALCSRKGDRWYIMDHDCPHFTATTATARPSHSPSSFPPELLEQLGMGGGGDDDDKKKGEGEEEKR